MSGPAAGRPCCGSSRGSWASEKCCTPPRPGEESQSSESERGREEESDWGKECAEEIIIKTGMCVFEKVFNFWMQR